MDYEKKYKEALERARQIHSEHKAQCFDVMAKVFPELAEDEDEKVRKEIIDLVKSQKEQQWHRDGAIYDRMIAWLEKQGEKRINSYGIGVRSNRKYLQKKFKNMWHFYPDNFSSYEEYVDYLKEKGLAFDAPQGMYNFE